MHDHADLLFISVCTTSCKPMPHLILKKSTISSSGLPTSLPYFPFLLCLYSHPHLDVQKEGFRPPIFLAQARLHQTLFALTNGTSAKFLEGRENMCICTMDHFCLCHCCVVSVPSRSETTFPA